MLCPMGFFTSIVAINFVPLLIRNLPKLQLLISQDKDLPQWECSPRREALTECRQTGPKPVPHWTGFIPGSVAGRGCPCCCPALSWWPLN